MASDLCLARSLLQAPKECPRGHQHDVETKGAMIFVRQTGMRAIGMEHFEQTLDIVLAVAGPFLSLDRQKFDGAVGQHLPQVHAALKRVGFGRIDATGDIIK